jgi:glycosyltransferase involved in cell wall biosynthesis
MKISVLVPVWNSGPVLERALQSVWSQTHRNFEIIVMDGASSDGTVDLIRRLENKITIWRSEKDEGTTDALNKGLKLATGELVTFLCADDYFADENVFADAVAEFEKDPANDLVAASLKMHDASGLIETHVVQSNPELMPKRMSVFMPGAFLRRSLLLDRQFSREVEIANDYELFSYLLQEKRARLKVLDRVNMVFALGGRSASTWSDFKKARETFYIRRRYYGFWAAWPAFARDLLISALRRTGFRPLSWARQLRRRLV